MKVYGIDERTTTAEDYANRFRLITWEKPPRSKRIDGTSADEYGWWVGSYDFEDATLNDVQAWISDNLADHAIPQIGIVMPEYLNRSHREPHSFVIWLRPDPEHSEWIEAE